MASSSIDTPGALESHQERLVASMAGTEELNPQLLAEHSVDMLCRVSLDRTMRYVSPSCQRILGWTPEEMVGVGPDAFVLAEDLPIIEAASRRILSPEVENSHATVRMRRKDGSFVWMEMNARLVRDSET